MKRRLESIAGWFALGGVILVGVLALIDVGEPDDPGLGDAAVLLSAALGVIGLLVALRWWSIAGEHPVTPDGLQISFMLRVAIAETGLLLGVVGFAMTGSMAAPIIGGALFLVALLVLVLGLRRDVESSA